ncbi:MAG: hypothetical protein SF069_03120 [Phycisphaerae bacterium]|nr:hypothetical protein [Phycisphaerae bacterium]
MRVALTLASTTAPGKLLSVGAQRLLTALTELNATAPERAVTDRVLAEHTRLLERHIIDHAFELIEHGWLILAQTTRPPGRYLTADLDLARRYERSLGSRAKEVLIRRRALRRAIAAHERKRRTESNGQGRLWADA